MSVDKFGRQASSSGNSGQRGPKGDGFVLTKEGDYDICRKRLRNVMEPENDDDAVNLKRLKTSLNKCLKHNNDKKYDANGFTLCNVRDPSEMNDAVNYKFIRNKCLVYDNSGGFNASNRLIVNVKDPISETDAANKYYVDVKCPPVTKNGWAFYNMKLSGVADPVNLDDAVNLNYFKKNLPQYDSSIWDFVGKRLTNIADPVNMQDSVTLNYLVRSMSNILYAIYKELAPEGNPIKKMSKDEWIRNKLVEPFFIDPKTKIARNN